MGSGPHRFYPITPMVRAIIFQPQQLEVTITITVGQRQGQRKRRQPANGTGPIRALTNPFGETTIGEASINHCQSNQCTASSLGDKSNFKPRLPVSRASQPHTRVAKHGCRQSPFTRHQERRRGILVTNPINTKPQTFHFRRFP